MASKRVKDGPHWVKAWISELSSLTDQFRDIDTGAVDFEALGREEYHFRMALSRRDFSNSERARKVWEDAVGRYQQRIKAASKDKNRKEATGNDQVPAGDASSREAEDESATVSGKNYAEEGGTRKDPLNMTHVRKNGALESGTSSANLRGSARPQKTGAGASIAPLLISPLENRAPSPTIAKRSDKKQPVNIGAAAPAPHLGPLDCHNREPQAPSPGDSHISGDVMSLAYSGEFGNVRLTQEQYAQLGIKFGNQQKLNRAIDSLSCQIENGEKNPQNHYAELVKWASYRDDMEEKEELRASSAPHYETVSEHNARIVRESDAWIHEYCQQQKKNRKAANG